MVVLDKGIYDEGRQTAVAVSGTDVEISPTRAGKKARIAWQITPTTAGIVVSINLGGTPAVLNAGTTLITNQPAGESAPTVKDAYDIVWQGPIHAIASGAGSVSITERYEP